GAWTRPVGLYRPLQRDDAEHGLGRLARSASGPASSAPPPAIRARTAARGAAVHAGTLRTIPIGRLSTRIAIVDVRFLESRSVLDPLELHGGWRPPLATAVGLADRDGSLDSLRRLRAVPRVGANRVNLLPALPN